MLDAYIIDRIRREREEKERLERPRLRLPLYIPEAPPPSREEGKSDRGIEELDYRI